MKKKDKKADGIFCSDMHLREKGKNPEARSDNVWDAQWKKLDFISELQQENECDVFHAGDLFDHWDVSDELLAKTIEHLPDDFNTVYGNHDLPLHSMLQKHKCGVYVLHKARVLHAFDAGAWKYDPDGDTPVIEVKGRKILIWHKYVYKQKEFWKADMGGAYSSGLLRKYPNYDVILTGDNHEAFTDVHKGRLLVNPGSMIRSTAKQIDFRPRVYLWYADTNTVEPVYLPIEENVITREHLEKKENKDKRIQVFIENLDTQYDSDANLDQKIQYVFQKNKTKESVQQIVLKAMDHV